MSEFKEQVIGLRLINGEGFLVTTTPGGDYKNMVQLVATQQGSGLLSMLDIIKTLSVNADKIAYTFEPTEDCKKHYSKLVREISSDIVVPESRVLI